MFSRVLEAQCFLLQHIRMSSEKSIKKYKGYFQAAKYVSSGDTFRPVSAWISLYPGEPQSGC